MTFALWAILAAALLPYVTVGAAKFAGTGYDNAQPRHWVQGLQGWRQRAEWAHRNHLEAFPPFAAAVLVAQAMGVPEVLSNWLAGTFLVFRIGYTVAYVANMPVLRSVLWFMALACVIGLFIASHF